MWISDLQRRELFRKEGLGEVEERERERVGRDDSITSMNARHSERKRRDSFSLSIREALYLSKELETACSFLISSWARTGFKLTGAQGLSSFMAADTPRTFAERGG